MKMMERKLFDYGNELVTLTRRGFIFLFFIMLLSCENTQLKDNFINNYSEISSIRNLIIESNKDFKSLNYSIEKKDNVLYIDFIVTKIDSHYGIHVLYPIISKKIDIPIVSTSLSKLNFKEINSTQKNQILSICEKIIKCNFDYFNVIQNQKIVIGYKKDSELKLISPLFIEIQNNFSNEYDIEKIDIFWYLVKDRYELSL